MSVILTSFFTSNSSPVSGLSPTIRVWEVAGGSHTLVVGSPDSTMIDVGDGFYKFEFTSALGYDPFKDYVYRTDAGPTLQIHERFAVGNTSQQTMSNEAVEQIVNGVWEETASDHLTVGSTGALLNETHANAVQIRIDAAAAVSLLTTLIKYESNRTKINTNTNTLTVYDDDCTTVLQVFDLKDSDGNPSVIEVCERVPQTCP